MIGFRSSHLGEIVSEWAFAGDGYSWNIVIPPNCEAEIDVGQHFAIRSQGHAMAPTSHLKLGSGCYMLDVQNASRAGGQETVARRPARNSLLT